ncbi:MAG: hypothetical protein AAF639_33905 [Chloroflexota bacterium]
MDQLMRTVETIYSLSNLVVVEGAVVEGVVVVKGAVVEGVVEVEGAAVVVGGGKDRKNGPVK